MLVASRCIPLTSLFHSPLSLLSASNHMAKIVNSTTDSSPLLPLPDTAVHIDSAIVNESMAHTSEDTEELLMLGSFLLPVSGKNVKNYSLPWSPSTKPFADKHCDSELMSSSNNLTSPPIATTDFEQRTYKRRSRIDSGFGQGSGHNCSVPRPNFQNCGLTLTKKFSSANLTTPHDESPQGSYYWKKKSESVNGRRPYNSPSNSKSAEAGHKFDSWKKKTSHVSNRPYNRPYNSPNNSNYAGFGHKLDASVGIPEFKPYDICFHERRNSALIGATLPSENKESYTEILRPGMVLLKNYITHDEQVEIVKVCRELGLGPGGFYQPGYANGAKLRLKMMCLGMDWDHQTYKYGKKRLVDGSVPPSIPNHFSELVERAIKEAHSQIKKEKRVWNVENELPSMTPDVCIVNFYTNNGRLGLHQDRDESIESLRKGLPVVSFSIGDSAEFLYGDERDVENAECVSRIRRCVDIWW